MSDLERVEGWGLSTASLCHVERPTDAEGVRKAFSLAAERGWTVGLRGAGRSYGDASQNDGGLLLDLQEWNRVQGWDPETGIARVDPGVTVEQLWERVVQDGWWPKVVSGTMTPTIGGAAAMNIHGKNAYKVGTIGDWIQGFDLISPSGDLHCSRDENADVFHAAIGGFGELGVMHNISLKNHFVDSGRLMEYPFVEPNLDAMFDHFEELRQDADYCVGWIDAFAGGSSLGRGQIHTANYLSADEDPRGLALRPPDKQRLPDRLFGVIPKSIMWRFVRPFAHPLGMRMINLAKVIAGEYAPGSKSPYHQTHAGFHFLLDFIPDWKLMHGRRGLIQFQPFVPADAARAVFGRLLRMQQERGLVNWLTVMKRHKPDPFLMTHGLDGWSLAQDFNVTDKNRAALWALCRDMTEVVLDAGGRFYPAKDATLTAAQFQRSLGQATISEFRALKKRLDPDTRIQTNLWRRLMA